MEDVSAQQVKHTIPREDYVCALQANRMTKSTGNVFVQVDNLMIELEDFVYVQLDNPTTKLEVFAYAHLVNPMTR